MNIQEVEKYFGTIYAACKALDLVPQNMTKWKNQGYITLLQQYRIAELTDGKLMPDEIDPKMAKKKPKKPKVKKIKVKDED